MTAPRRTQAERTERTRALLIAAAVDSLVEKGWAATTTVEVCRRTGLTRGALVHHFPSLAELLAAALQSVCDDLIALAGHEPASLVDALDVTWECMRDPRFKAVIEAWLAAANDPELRREIAPVVANIAEIVSPAGTDDEIFYLTARETMLGLALGRATAAGRALPHETAVLDGLRAEAALLDRRRTRKGNR